MDKIDFEYWANLYATDPVEYEKQRVQLLEQHILSAPVEHRNSMRMIQLECDTIRQMYPPLEATVKIAELMVENLKVLRARMTELREMIEDSNDTGIQP